MLPRHLAGENTNTSWQDLAVGAPTIIAIATLCGRALSGVAEAVDVETLDPYAKTLLVAARQRGVFDIRGNQEAFDSSDRFLAVCVEVEEDRRLLFRRKDEPRETMRFLDGFCQLCRAGLVIHHLQRDFSLTRRGFELADALANEQFESRIDFACEIEH